jgi:hypothetical protein
LSSASTEPRPTPASDTSSWIVPQSARAPHQVVSGGDLRFYGRGAKGNRILTEGEIARLYERRRGWEQDRAVLLGTAVEANRARFRGHTGTVTAFARPVLPDHMIWERATESAGGRDELQRRLQGAARWQETATPYDPSFARSILDWHQLGSHELRPLEPSAKSRASRRKLDRN